MFQNLNVLTSEVGSLRSDVNKLQSNAQTPSYGSRSNRRPRRQRTGPFALPHTPQPRDDERNLFMRLFRREMNQCLHIQQDAEIWLHYKNPLSRTTLKSMQEYLEREGCHPTVSSDTKHLPIYWEALHSVWNTALCDQFVDYFVAQYQEYDTDQGKAACKDHFWQRLKTLHYIIKKHVKAQGESALDDEEAALRLYNAWYRKSLKRMRRRTRRVELYDARKETAAGIAAALDAEGAPEAEHWWKVSDMIERLGTGGMSTDTSDCPLDREPQGKPRLCHVFKKPWRSEQVSKLLSCVDRYKAKRSKYGNNAPGNQPHVCERPRYAADSTSKPVAKLPGKFYNRSWYRTQYSEHQAMLDAASDFDLPEAQE
ncbi:hypothetical protein VKT23_015081 [Stygiomarasmius scandens]|uniref:Uncharacterized protein n=1 Tax=Marasmiellus scandens TaxID=2682957 RepID=A0ABR1IZX6_9AGAR